MELKIMRSLWGVEVPLEQALPAFKNLGYSGVEAAIPFVSDLQRLADLLEQHGLQVIAQVLTAFPASDRTPEAHLQALKAQVEQALPLKPLLLNVQGGCDHWSEAEQDRFYREALQYAADLPCPLAFETHRGQPTFTPWTTARLLQAFPDLKLTGDFSHWVNVCERLLEDQQDHLRLAASRCIHLHTRVGFEEGPQVSDPAAPEFAAHLQAHEQWWTWVWEAQRERGDTLTTLTPEFGPPPYQPTLPFSQQPTGDLDAICNWMMERQRSRFETWNH